MISANNPFDKEIDIEDNIAVKCDICGHFTVLKYYYDKDLNIERETAKIKHYYKNNPRIRYQCDLIPEIYNMYRRHPVRIINELVSSYWTAWDYDVANKNGIKNLIGKCHNCNKVLKHERLDKIKEIKGNKMKIDDNIFWILFWLLCVVFLSICFYFKYKTEEIKQQTKIKIEQMNIEDRQKYRDTLDKYKEDIKNILK